MKQGLNIAFFGSSLVSAYWNGAATYYRGIIRALHELGHTITFYEPDAYDRQRHRDLADPAWASVVVYNADDETGVRQALCAAKGADLVVKTSGVGVFDALLEEAVLDFQGQGSSVAFWDVDAPATLDRIAADKEDPFRACIPAYDFLFTYGGGEPVIAKYKEFGARNCYPIYNAFDPMTHYPVPAEPRFAGICGFLGNRLPDREARVEEFFLKAAAAMPDERFVLGGNAWDDKPMMANVNYLGYVSPQEHNAFNCTPRAVLNINRSSMARYGFSPPTRVFEAAGVGACLITDAWEGVDHFLEPGEEILVADDGEGVVAHLRTLDGEMAQEIGSAARRRVLDEHTYAQRAAQVDRILHLGPI